MAPTRVNPPRRPSSDDPPIFVVIDGSREIVQILEAGVAGQHAGELEFEVEGERFARVCLYRGRVAWAQCATHHENFGDVFRRELHVTDGTLRNAVRYCQRRGVSLVRGLARLGLADESGIQRCLKFHMRGHLRALIRPRDGLLGAAFVPQRHRYHDAFTFALEQLLPPKPRRPKSGRFVRVSCSPSG